MKDNFSAQSVNYEKYRPDYPAGLYEYIFSYVKDFGHAWDCATGNGQAAKRLSRTFGRVEASDISQKQLDNAWQAANIHYHVCPAESTPFNDDQFDLITVAQALHWFDFDRFFTEVKRVLRPSGVLAVWTYGLLSINPEIDTVLTDFHTKITGPYWDDERKHVDNQYREINFPFSDVLNKTFFMPKNWSLETLAGYLQTWSSVEKYKKVNGRDPVTAVKHRLEALWPGGECQVTFPVYLYLLGNDLSVDHSTRR